MSERLYKVVWITPDEDHDANCIMDHELEDILYEPNGWREYSIGRFGEYKPFFFPSTNRVYKSRSAAVNRADLINSWGGNVEVLECTPRWQTLEDARDERTRRRLHDRAQKLRERLAQVQEKAQALA